VDAREAAQSRGDFGGESGLPAATGASERDQARRGDERGKIF
jgi:hypothetical protein